MTNQEYHHHDINHIISSLIVLNIDTYIKNIEIQFF